MISNESKSTPVSASPTNKTDVVQPFQPATPQILLVSHHKHGTITVNGTVLGDNKVYIDKPADSIIAIATETRFGYTTKPDTLNFKEVRKKYGVGGKPKEFILSFGYFSGSTGGNNVPAQKITLGFLRQSTISNSIAVIFSKLGGGFLYQWGYDFEFKEKVKIGLGLNAGCTQFADENYGKFKMGDLKEPITTESFFSMGGPRIRTAIGYKNVFIESGLTLNMGVYLTEIIGTYQYWDGTKTVPGTKGDNYGEFKMQPAFECNLLFTL